MAIYCLFVCFVFMLEICAYFLLSQRFDFSSPVPDGKSQISEVTTTLILTIYLETKINFQKSSHKTY